MLLVRLGGVLMSQPKLVRARGASAGHGISDTFTRVNSRGVLGMGEVERQVSRGTVPRCFARGRGLASRLSSSRPGELGHFEEAGDTNAHALLEK